MCHPGWLGRGQALVEILLLSGVTPNAVFRGAFPSVAGVNALSALAPYLTFVPPLPHTLKTQTRTDLAHAWGREKNFHLVLVNTVCSRRGEVERKKRSNAGTRLGKRRRPHQKQEQHKGQPVQEDHERKVGQQVQHHQQDGLEEEDNGVGSSTSSSSPASLSNKRRRPYGPPDLNGGPVGHQEEEDDDNDHYDNDDNSNIPYSEDDHPLPGAEDRGSFAAGAPAPLHSEATGGVAVSDPVATSGQPHLAERDGDDDFGNGGKSIADPLEAAAV